MALTEKDKKYLAAFAVVLFICIASIPVICPTLLKPAHHDLIFHLYRIDGLAEGLKSGQFPVRFQGTQLNGLMYPVSIMYGDLFLYFPAILRCMGLSVYTAYKAYMVVVNAFCAVTTYIVFRRMFQSRAIGVLASCLWTLSAYRLFTDTWLRSAVGEYTALAFLPMIIYGLYSLWQYGKSGGASRRAWLWLAFGAAGIVYSHVLSSMMVAIVCLPFLVLVLVLRHDKHAWGQLGKAALAFVLLVLAFAVPFADFYLNAGLAVSSMPLESKFVQINNNMLQLSQLFMVFASCSGTSLPVDSGLDEMPTALGAAIVMGSLIALALLLLPSARKNISRSTRVLCVLLIVVACLLVFLTSVYFPWEKMLQGGLVGKFFSLIATVQFSWRYVGLISIILVLFASLGVNVGRRRFGQRFAIVVVCAICTVACLESAAACTSFMTQTKLLPQDFTEISSSGVSEGEYLPAGGSKEYLNSDEAQQVVPAGTVSVESWNRDAGTVSLYADGGAEGGSVVVPLLYYPGYMAVGDAGETFNVYRNNDGLVCIGIPAGFDGEVTVSFHERLLWRVSFGISVAFLMGLAAWGLLGRIRKATRRPSCRP